MSLIEAVKNGDAASVQRLVEGGVSLNATNSEGLTPLHVAAAAGNLPVVDVLLRAGADSSVPSTQSGRMHGGETALIAAARAGHDAVVDTLLRSKANVNQTKISGDVCALFVAAQEGHVDVVQTLLRRHADPTLRSRKGTSALCAAATQGHENVVQCLVNLKGMVNVEDENGITPLCMASARGHTSILKCLLRNGATLETGFPALDGACRFGRLECARVLLEAKANVRARPNCPSVCFTANQGSANVKETIELLLENKANLNDVDSLYCSPLYYGVQKFASNPELTEFLLRRKASPAIGQPLLAAIQIQDTALMARLIALKAPVDAPMAAFYSPLQWAVTHGTPETGTTVVDVLLRAKARVDRKILVQAFGSPETVGIARLLVHAKGDINCCHENEEEEEEEDLSLLQHACAADNVEGVRLLLHLKASCNNSSMVRDAPLTLACRSGRTQIVRLLLAAKASVNAHCDDSIPRNAMDAAALHGDHDLMKLLFQNGARVQNSDIFAPVIRHGNLATVQLLVHHRADVNAVIRSVWSPLTVAIHCRRDQIARCLVYHQASLDHEVRTGVNAIALAATHQPQLAPWLKMVHGFNAVHWACLRNDEASLQELVSSNRVRLSDIVADSKQGITPYNLAFDRPRFPILFPSARHVEVSDQVKQLIAWASRPWEPTSHRIWPLPFRTMVFHILCVARRLNHEPYEATALNLNDTRLGLRPRLRRWVPMTIWYQIISFLGRDDWE